MKRQHNNKKNQLCKRTKENKKILKNKQNPSPSKRSPFFPRNPSVAKAPHVAIATEGGAVTGQCSVGSVINKSIS